MHNEFHSRIEEAVRRYTAQAVELSETLAERPECSGAEFESSALFAQTLEAAGYRVEFPFCGMPTAFRAALHNGAGPAVALLAEYDALPGMGHACGHNLHGALSVLAALALAGLRDDFRGTLYVIGTPDEEITGGKIAMAKEGVFDGLALALMTHSCAGGLCQANMDALSLRGYTLGFTGRSAHTANPWEGRSALAAARKFLDLADARRECLRPDVRVNGIITKGGEAVNIIPAYAELNVEFRTASLGTLAFMDDMVKKCARGAAIALECEETWTRAFEDFADMVRLPSLEHEIERIFTGLGLKTRPVAPPIGSTDVGNVSYRCPALQPLLAITGGEMSLHTPEFAAAARSAEAHAVLPLGAEALILLALKVFNDENFRLAVQREFEYTVQEKTKGVTNHG